MPDLSIPALLAQAAEKLRSDFEYIRSTNPHSGDKGLEAEEILRAFLNHHLPQRFKAAAGTIIDDENKLSRQTDVIIYDQLASPVYRYSDSHLILPNDCVAAVLEVKSRLNKGDLEDGYAKIASCKTLRKRPLSEMDLRATGSPLRSITTFGAVFGFESDITLAKLAEHAEELNRKYTSAHWPSAIVVLDKGIIHYCLQFPYSNEIGHLMPSEANGYPYQPPFFVHLAIQDDGIYTLNRFFLLLLSHLTFFPRRASTPSFETALSENAKQCTTVCGYQYDRKQQLVPVEFPSKPIEFVPAILLTASNGEQLGALHYFARSDGCVLRWKGRIPGAPIFGILQSLVPGVEMQTLRHSDAEYTTVVPVAVETFEEWPAKFNAHLEGMTASLHRYNALKVAEIGVSDPFVARMLAGMFHLRDKSGVDRDRFDSSYSPVVEALVLLHGSLNPNSTLQQLLPMLQRSDPPENPHVLAEAGAESLARTAVELIVKFATSFDLDLSFLLGPETVYGAGVGACYAEKPGLAQYLIAARLEWLGRLVVEPDLSGTPTSASDQPPVSASWDRIANLAETIAIHVLQNALPPSLAIREIPLAERRTVFPCRFNTALQSEVRTRWEPRYEAKPFHDC